MALRHPTPGLLVDNKYRLAERIGGGGMGDVFRAENVLAGRSVAIKFLRRELAEDQDLAQRFFQEAQAVNRIRHPNIVDVLDAGVSESGPYIVMEHLEGEAVGSALARVGRFEVDAAVATAIPVLEALDAAHRLGIIHRDLKPENVFLAFDPAKNACLVRLLDFGIAKVLATSGPSPRTRTGIVFGTPDYLSPEQATGDAPLDGRSDLFAVGVLLYELLTGTRPFRAPTAVATAFRVVHSDPAGLASAGITVPPKLEQIVQRLLQKEPSRRYPTAGDVVTELLRVEPDMQRRVNALVRVVHGSRRGRGLPLPVAEPREPLRGRGSAPDLLAAGGMGGGTSTPVGAPPHTPTRLSSGGVAKRGFDSSTRVDRVPSRPEPSRPEPARASEPGSPPSPSRPGGDSGTRPASGARDATLRTPQVRPFPARFAGKYHVRGPMLRGVDRAVIDMFGKAMRDDVVMNLPDEYGADLRNDSINALVAYELEALDAYMELATMLFIPDIWRWRELGRMSATGELFSAIRAAIRPAENLAVALRRGVTAWSRLMSFGVWRVGSQGDHATLNIGELDPASQPMRLWLLGVVEATLRLAMNAEVKANITLGEIGFLPDLMCEFIVAGPPPK